jgi:aryl-alcohol dehydrogenase-like predicted oxidoreductase
MLNNCVQMPAIGLGVFQTPPDETTSSVEAALSTGYRHIDTAAAYSNEREVGEGIRRSGLDRSEVFIETKVWISDYWSGTAAAIAASATGCITSSTSTAGSKTAGHEASIERWERSGRCCDPRQSAHVPRSATPRRRAAGSRRSGAVQARCG